MRSRPRVAILFVLAIALAACGADQPVSDDPGASQPSGGGVVADGTLTITDDTVDGPAISIADAAAADGPVKVGGALFVDADGRMLLCDAVAESFPPQCGGTRLVVAGLDLDSVDLEEANGVRWAEGVELIGTIGD